MGIAPRAKSWYFDISHDIAPCNVLVSDTVEIHAFAVLRITNHCYAGSVHHKGKEIVKRQNVLDKVVHEVLEQIEKQSYFVEIQ